MIRPLAFIALLFTSVATALTAAEPLPKVIRFGEVGGVNVKSVGGKPASAGLVALAQHLGYFDEEFAKDSIRIEQIFFANTGPAQNEALAQGDIEFGSYGGVPNVIGLAGKIPAKIVAARRLTGAGNSYYIGVKPGSPIKTLADLKGKRIAVQKGTNPYLSLITVLEANGVLEKDITLVNLIGAEALVAFNAGAIDAVFGGVNLLILRDQGKLDVLTSTRDIKIPGNSSGFLVSDRFAKAHPQLVTRVLKVLTRASHWASQEENREPLLRFVSERSWAYEYIKADYAGSLKIRYNPIIDDSVVKSYEELVRFGVERKLLRRAPDEKTIRGWFDPSFQQAALKELKLEGFWDDASGE